MLFVLLIFALVYVFRDGQVLAVKNRLRFSSRFAVYAAIQLAAVAIMILSTEPRPGIANTWTRRPFAVAALLIQAGELGIALLLRKLAGGEFAWIGCTLPSPVLLVALFSARFAMQNVWIVLDPSAALGIVTGVWLVAVSVCAFIFGQVERDADDPKFAGDFALMTSCTALVFVPFGFF
jgi:hypothetical protein